MQASDSSPCDSVQAESRSRAWRIWLQHHRVIGTTLSGFRSLSAADRDEIASDAGLAFVTASCRRPQSIHATAAWIRQIVANAAKSYLRRRRRLHAREQSASLDQHVDDGMQAPSRCVETFEDADRVMRELERLQSSLRLVASARLVSNQGYSEIACDLGVSETTARKRMQLARRLLARRLSLADSRANSSRAG